MARLVLDLPSGQTPGLAAVVNELGVDASPAHAALSDAQATAAVFRELIRRASDRFGWATLGDLLAVLERPEIARSGLELRRRHSGSRRVRPVRPARGAGGGRGGQREPGSPPA